MDILIDIAKAISSVCHYVFSLQSDTILEKQISVLVFNILRALNYVYRCLEYVSMTERGSQT